MTTICMFLVGFTQLMCITTGTPTGTLLQEPPLYISYWDTQPILGEIQFHHDLLLTSIEDTCSAIQNIDNGPGLDDYEELREYLRMEFMLHHDAMERLKQELVLTPVIIPGDDPIYFFPQPIFEPIDPIDGDPHEPPLPLPWGGGSLYASQCQAFPLSLYDENPTSE